MDVVALDRGGASATSSDTGWWPLDELPHAEVPVYPETLTSLVEKAIRSGWA